MIKKTKALLSLSIGAGLVASILGGPLLAEDTPVSSTTPPAANDAVTGSSTVPSKTASLVSGVRLATRVTLFRQINGLNLTPGQLKEITQRLSRLDSYEKAYQARKDAALRPVAAQLQRVQDALLANRPPDPADQAQVDAAVAPLQPEAAQLIQLRKETVRAIRQALTQDEINVVRIDLGMDSPQAQTAGATDPAAAGSSAGGAPNGDPSLNGTAGGGTVGSAAGTQAGGAGTAAPTPGQGRGRRGNGGRPTSVSPQDYVTRMLDRVRSLPDDRYNRAKDYFTQAFVTHMGIDPNSPEFAQTQNSIADQFKQVRQYDDNQYRQVRDQLVTNMTQKLPNAPVSLNRGGRGGPGQGGRRGGRGGQGRVDANGNPVDANGNPLSPAEVAAAEDARHRSDDDAIRRFFLQPDALAFLRTKPTA